MTTEQAASVDPATIPAKPDEQTLEAHKGAALDALCEMASLWLAGRAADVGVASRVQPDLQRSVARPTAHGSALDPHPVPETDVFADVDIEVVAWLACVQNLEPLLHGVVANRSVNNAMVPLRLRDRWRHAYFANTAINMAVLDNLAELAHACEKASVPVVVLKGLVTAHRAFGDVGLRMISDIDLVCRRQDCERVAESARELGFIGGQVTSTIHTHMLHKTLPTSLEIHFGGYDFFPDEYHFVEKALTEREWITVESVTLPALSGPLHVAFDVAHLVHHDFSASLQRWLEVAAELRISSRTPDWPLVLTQARGMGIEPELASAWSVMADMFGPPPGRGTSPPGLAADAIDAELPKAARMAMLRIDSGSTDQPLAEAASRAGSLASARFVARLLLPGRSAIVAAYGGEVGVLRSTLRHLRATLRRGWKKLRRVRQAPGGTPPSSLGVKRDVYARRARAASNPTDPNTDVD